MNKKSLQLIFSVISAILLILTIKIGISLFSNLSESISNSSSVAKSIKTEITGSTLIDSALSEKGIRKTFSYEKAIQSPFSLLNSKRIQHRSVGHAVNTVSRMKLFLKGILNKKDALAILEDKNGKTFICKIGDKVYGWTVAEIRDEKVVIKDGKYQEILEVVAK